MPKYIDAEAQIAMLREKIKVCDDLISRRDGPCYHDESDKIDALNDRALAYEEAITMLESAPAADVAEVVHGHWIGTVWDGYAGGNPVYGQFECSVCGYEHAGEKGTLTDYCPECGSRMDEPSGNSEHLDGKDEDNANRI